jgi:hypothetical protein
MKLYQQISNLLLDKNFILIEDFILHENNVDIDNEIDIKLLVSFISNEITCSNLDFLEIVNYIYDNKNNLLSFSKKFISIYNIRTLSRGFLINYSIYLILSRNNEFKLLEKYLACRKIPQQKLVLVNIKLSLKQ